MLGLILIYIISSHPTFRKTFIGQILGFERSYEAHRLIIGSDTTCDRTTRNNTPSEALVFHQILSTPKASYIGWVPSSTPQGRAQIIHIFPPGSNNENEITILSPFHTTRVLRNTLLQYQVQSAKFKQWNKHLTIRYKDPFEPTRRILHTTATPQATPTTEVNKS